MEAKRRDTDSIRHQQGMGNWQAWGDDLRNIWSAAKSWRERLAGIQYPWLCWNVNNDWCFVQQKLVLEAGWTPVVGFDPRCGPPTKVVPGAVVVDFNEHLGLPVLYPHFPLEFAFLFCERLAFWHSDLLVRESKMRLIAERFRNLMQGETAAVSCMGWREIFSPLRWRYWELIGCTTKTASEDQFRSGCGWWLHFYDHPNRHVNQVDSRLRLHYWDHGAGIMYWRRRHGGRVVELREKEFSEGHFSQIKFDDYKRISPNNEFRDLRQDLINNFYLYDCAKSLNLERLVEGADTPLSNHYLG